jgi:hypothetical protein
MPHSSVAKRASAANSSTCPWQAWRRPTLPRLETQYHRRWSFSRPSSGWDRVFTLRQYHQASEGQSEIWSQRIREWALTMRAIKPIERLVLVSFMHCCTSTPSLSTWWSSTALKGELVSRWVSRLDAFSGYPFRTWLPCYAAGATTGPLEVRPSRSSRTRDRSSQFSYTYGR